MKYFTGMGKEVTLEIEAMAMGLNTITEKCRTLASALDDCTSKAIALEQENTKLKETIKNLRRLKNVPEVTE